MRPLTAVTLLLSSVFAGSGACGEQSRRDRVAREPSRIEDVDLPDTRLEDAVSGRERSFFRRMRLPPMPYLENFSSAEGSPAGFHTAAGFKRAFAETLDKPAWLLAAVVGSTIAPRAAEHSLPTNDETLLTTGMRGRFLFGRQEMLGNLYLAGFVGPELEVKIDPLAARPVRRRYGVRAEGHVWFRPSDGVVLGFVASAGTALEDVWTRARVGRRFFDLVTVGPEAGLSAAPRYVDQRVGLFASEIKLSNWTVEGSAGRMRDSDGRNGWYGTLANTRRF